MPKQLNAKAWLQSFKKQYIETLRKGSWQAGASSTTAVMSGLLHSLQEEFGVHCLCQLPRKKAESSKKHDRVEALEIDMTWYPSSANTDPDGNWDAALFALEHECSWDEFETKKDFWRVFQFAAPLRVFIGYAPHEKAENRLKTLTSMRLKGKTDRFHRLPGGEDILLLGSSPLVGYERWLGRVWDDSGFHAIDWGEY
jgi:hypothetical protein